MNASLVYQSAMAAALAAPVESESDWIESAHGFARIKTAAGGFVSLKNCAVRLRDFADTVRKNWQAFGAGPKPAELVKPKKPRGAIAWPAVTLKVWRELIEAGQHAEALELGAEKLGLRCYIGSGPFAVAAPMPVEGLSEFFASGRRDDGRFIVYDTVSGVSIGARGAASRKSAEESAREMWNDRTEEQHETALRSARNMYRTGPEAARIAWMKHHGIACDDAPQSEPEPIADDAEPAAEVIQPAPVNPEPEPAEPNPEPIKPAAPHPLADSAADLERRRAMLAEAKPAEAGFRAELLRYAEKDFADLSAAFAAFDAIGDGTELSTADGRRHCVLLPDASEPGRYRYSVFNARGFYSHSTHNTAAEAVADAARAGFTVAAPGILDRLAATQEWAHGSEVAAVMQQHNFGRLSWQDACAEFDRLAAVYAKPAGPEPETAPAEPIAQDAPPDIEPAAPIASRAPGRLAAGNIRPHRAAIAQHRAGRLAATPRGAVHSIGRAAWPGRGAPPAAPGPGVRAAAGAGPPG